MNVSSELFIRFESVAARCFTAQKYVDTRVCPWQSRLVLNYIMWFTVSPKETSEKKTSTQTFLSFPSFFGWRTYTLQNEE